MAGPVKFSKYSSKNLTKGLNTILIQQLAKVKIFQSRWLIILIGISKIINATVLMSLYVWRRSWDEKFWICLCFVILSAITYLAEYLIVWLWWPNYMGTFYKEGNPSENFIICSGATSYSDSFDIAIYCTNSTTFFQRLGKPVVEEKIPFEQYFTQSGYLVTDEWRRKCDQLISRALAAPKPKHE